MQVSSLEPWSRAQEPLLVTSAERGAVGSGRGPAGAGLGSSGQKQWDFLNLRDQVAPWTSEEPSQIGGDDETSPLNAVWRPG